MTGISEFFTVHGVEYPVTLPEYKCRDFRVYEHTFLSLPRIGIVSFG